MLIGVLAVGVFVGAAYVLLAVSGLPILFGLAIALVLAILSAAALRSGRSHPRAKAILALAIAAAVFIGVPVLATSHQGSQQADNQARFSAYRQRTIDQGLTTQAQWDEIDPQGRCNTC